MSRFFRPETVFFLVVWAALLVLFRQRAFYDPGALWHVKVGDLILAHGFMHTDPFTYTFAGKTWIPQQWGAEVMMSLAHKAGGFDAMLLMFSTGIAGLFTWIFARMRSGGMHWALAGVLAGGCLFAGAFHFFCRPHLTTIALMGWTMACLVDFDRGKVGLGRLAALIPVCVIWTNLHGGILGGVATFGLAVAGWGLLFLWSRYVAKPAPTSADDVPVTSWRTGWILIGIVIACLLTPMVNPFGMEMINTWMRIVGSPVLKEVVNEHKPLDVTQAADQAIVGFAAAYLFLLAGTLPHRPRVTWLIPLVWFLLTFQGIRQGPLFVITGAVCIADLWPHTVWFRLLKKHGDTFAVEPGPTGLGWPAFALPAMAVLAAFGLQVNGIEVPVIGRGWARLEPHFTPIQLTDRLEAYALTRGPNARIFNDANFGGYLIYHVPTVKIFMDDRFELYGDTWTAAYIDAIWHHPERIEGWCDEYGLDLALVSANEDDPSPLDVYLKGSPRWVELARTECAALYQRKKAP